MNADVLPKFLVITRHYTITSSFSIQNIGIPPLRFCTIYITFYCLNSTNTGKKRHVKYIYIYFFFPTPDSEETWVSEALRGQPLEGTQITFGDLD